MNGFQATVALVDPNMFTGTADADTHYQDRFGYEAKASYSFTGDVSGKVWVSGASYDLTAGAAATAADDDTTVSAVDIGANVNYGNFGLTGYYYDGRGAGITAFGLDGISDQASGLKKRDSDGGYIQATYIIPTGTKLGLAYGVSNLDKANAADTAALIDKQDRWTVGAYHPLTKHLNLVAEYNQIEREAHNDAKNEYDSISLGAILFF
jgi:predicted porin